MLVMKPRQVTFGTEVWPNVDSIAINRKASKLVTDFSDSGPHVTLADVPEQLIEIEVEQSLVGGSEGSPLPGVDSTLVFTTSINSSDAATERVSVRAVVSAVSYEVGRKVSKRMVRLVAVSSNGVADPVVRTSIP